VSGLSNPVFQIIDEASGEIVYTLRIKGSSFRPKVFKEGMYTVKIGEPGTDDMKSIRGVHSLPLDKQLLVDVKF
jgi:hypothetical protein